jgi:predicted amino acid dehydrogenase
MPAIADADGDIAALVYASGDRPDQVLYAFARHLTDGGRRVCGLVQLRDRSCDGSPCSVIVLDSWKVVDFIRVRAQEAAEEVQCRLDAYWLDRMAARTKTTIRRGVDAVIVNRFGPLEVAGRGFSEAIAVASETKTPLVIAVPKFEFERWTRFSNGMTVKLECRLDRVLDWWHRALSSRPLPAFDARACELLK